MRINTKTDRGVAGLTILLSLVTMLFVIGLIVMIFSLMGGELRNATFTSTVLAVVNESQVANTTTEVFDLDNSVLQDASCSTVATVYNGTNGLLVTSGNWTQTGCELNVSTASDDTDDYTWLINYDVTYGAENTATGVINDTTGSIATVTSWFDIFIVIGAMVVLILLTVIIITAIRGSGLMDGGGA